MNKECAIIRDLIPLYAENLCSDASAEFVKNHTTTCKCCNAVLAEHLKPAPIAPDLHCDGLQVLRKRLRKRTVFAIISAVLIILTLVAGVLVSATVPVWLSVDEAVVYAEQQPDGSVKVKLTDRVCHITYLDNDRFACQGMRISWFLTLTRNSNPVAAEHTFSFHPDDEQAFWYSGQYTEDQDALLWGTDTASVENSYFERLDRSVFYILLFSASVGALLLVCGFCLRKKRIGKWLLLLSTLFICCALSTLFVSGGHFYDTAIRNAVLLKYSVLVKRYIAIAVMTVISFAAVLLTSISIYEYRKD